jgi:hypothetical protein
MRHLLNENTEALLPQASRLTSLAGCGKSLSTIPHRSYHRRKSLIPGSAWNGFWLFFGSNYPFSAAY